MYGKNVKQHYCFRVRLSKYLHHKTLASEASLQCAINQGVKKDKKHVIKNSATLHSCEYRNSFYAFCALS